MEESLYNLRGDAIAYIAHDDDNTIYMWNGMPVAYIYDDCIYGFNGKHLGWFDDGYIRDLGGNILGSNEESAVGFVGFEPFKGFKQFSPFRAFREFEHTKPFFGYVLSHDKLDCFLMRGRA